VRYREQERKGEHQQCGQADPQHDQSQPARRIDRAGPAGGRGDRGGGGQRQPGQGGQLDAQVLAEPQRADQQGGQRPFGLLHQVERRDEERPEAGRVDDQYVRAEHLRHVRRDQ
jgi:hypothetical protein